MQQFNDKDNLLGPALASMRKRLGKLVDVYMDSKIAHAEQLADAIKKESDPDRLLALRKQLNDVLFSEDDIKQLDTKLKAGLAVLQTNGAAFIALREQFQLASEKLMGRHH